MVKEVRKRKTNTYDITYTWNLKYDTNELIYRTETGSQTYRIDCGFKEKGKRKRGVLGVWCW